ncbi:DUF6629 family protein [Actinacidiphila paucisporea]|uniref:Integral membrane protein n=1 Tax=Actinacidiphila paucisporea TaxID=310782 RepID=A0A1M7Q354_9ACTN|nr:DUF6629 family protein [Actinacidiphila paucisporea]SHN24528.1 hypothetical protein SAMN05216499_12880 [Actinacidiphila paucisporea]
MCWSATADLAAGSVVCALGAACVARTRRVRDLPLAALPLLLGAHQLIEAAVWHGGGGTGAGTTAWAVIALPLLPVWVPLAVLSAYPGARLRLAAPVAVGVLTAVALALCLADRAPSAHIHGHSVGYAVHVPHAPWLVAGYLFATVGAFLLAPDPTLRLLGATTAAGAVLCAILWRLSFVSTWCAVAATASLILLSRPTPTNAPGDA